MFFLDPVLGTGLSAGSGTGYWILCFFFVCFFDRVLGTGSQLVFIYTRSGTGYQILLSILFTGSDVGNKILLFYIFYWIRYWVQDFMQDPVLGTRT